MKKHSLLIVLGIIFVVALLLGTTMFIITDRSGPILGPSSKIGIIPIEGTISESDVIVSQIGVHIIKVEDVRPARTAPFAEVQSQIGKDLREQKRKRLYRDFIKKLWDQSYVDIRWK